jgi:hypothetical protein
VGRSGLEVIVVLGDVSHLAGRIAAYTTLPVIVVPATDAGQAGHSREWGTLLTALETPPGVPLAVVGTNAVYNGIYLAVQFLGVKDHRVRARLAELRAGHAARAEERAEAVEAYADELQRDTSQTVAGEAPRSTVAATDDVEETMLSSPRLLLPVTAGSPGTRDG